VWSPLKAEQIGAAAAAVGVILVVAAMLWPLVYNPRRQWSDEDAKAYEETVARVHVGAYVTAQSTRPARMHSHGTPDPERLRQHQQDVQTLAALKARLDAARESPFRVASLFKWSGVGLVAVGLVVLFAGRASPENSRSRSKQSRTAPR
jgi:hypothetical protein